MILSSFYSFANRRSFFSCENPIAAVERSRIQSLDPQEVAQRMHAIDQSTKQGARDYALLAVLFQTGRRLLEVIALRWHHVRVQGNKVTLVFEQCKGGKTMRDTLSMPVATALLEWLSLAYERRGYFPNHSTTTYDPLSYKHL